MMDLTFHASKEREQIPMIHVMRQHLAAAFLFVIGLSASGCGDTTTVSEPAELGNLSVSTGTLQPPFAPATTDYTVQLSSDVSSTTVNASPRVAGDTVRIDNQQTTSQTITLNSPGEEKSVSIVVTETGTGSGSKSYTVRVKRDLEDNSLLALSVSSGTLAPAPFDKDTLDYMVNNVGASVTSITISATKSDPDAVMQIGSVTVPAGTPSGQETVQLGGTGSTTPVSIDVTRPSGSKKTYTVTINRGASGNNNLQSLGISPGQLSLSFRSDRTSYTVNLPATLPSNVTSVRVTPTLQDANATMTVNGQAATSGQALTPPLPGPGSSTPVIIVVTAQNGTQKTYSVNVIRAALGGNNNLSALALSSGALDSPFNANDLSYTVNVGSTVTSVTVTATLQDTNATMTIEGQGTSSGQGRSISLGAAGTSTDIDILVTAPNGSQKPYRITVNKAALASNNNLSALTVSPGSLNPAFNANTMGYTANVDSAVSSVTVTATLQDTNASMTIEGQGTSSGQARSILLGDSPSSTAIDILVTAPNGSQKTTTITVNRAAPPAPASAPDLIPEDDSGFLPGQDADNITNVNTPRFRVPSPGAGETPNLYVDGGKVDATFDQGATTLKPTSALSGSDEGVKHLITSTVTNAAGLESPQSLSLEVTIDTGF